MNTTVVLDRPLISLADANAVAALQTRVDRKYLVDEQTLSELVDELPASVHQLEIGGRTDFGYRSTYFDTPGLDLYRAAAHRRRRRFKVRTRTYTDTSGCFLEVKAKGARGQNIKSRIEWPDLVDDRLTPTGIDFIDAATGTTAIASTLGPVLTTAYSRSTLVDVASATRLTIDRSLRCTDIRGRTTTLDAIVVEIKSGGAPSEADRWLWRRHVRPQRISKFCTGLAALDPALPSNRWHRVLDRHWKPAA
ncbi:polyphosphate polymerase domain-containing protein [Ilumatobacter sp.]|uniref:polyphosphate polymerase domain-containing protein n=1 Tax=Ilumatobacter sp. TaxID=1967498 RepID=UPI003C54E8BE